MPSIKTAKKFRLREPILLGFSLPLPFAVIGYMLWAKVGAHSFATGVWITGGVLLGCYLFVPRWRPQIQRQWKRVMFVFEWIVSNVALCLLFYGVISPAGSLMRLLGYDPMRRRMDHRASSYWIQRRGKSSLDRYFRQF